MQEAEPSLLAFLRTGSQCQHLFGAFQIHCQGRQNDSGIGFLAVMNTKMHAIEVEHTPMLLERTLSPGLKLLRERLVQATNGAGTGSHAQ
jgi:hypothetical protein